MVRVLCFLGSHSWTAWQEEACEARRRCSRSGCARAEKRLVHSWSEWEFITPGNCAQRRRCGKAGHVEERDSHEWQVSFDEELDGPSRKQITVTEYEVRSCERCPTTERTVKRMYTDSYDPR